MCLPIVLCAVKASEHLATTEHGRPSRAVDERAPSKESKYQKKKRYLCHFMPVYRGPAGIALQFLQLAKMTGVEVTGCCVTGDCADVLFLDRTKLSLRCKSEQVDLSAFRH